MHKLSRRADPSPAEIADACSKIRLGWHDREYRQRSVATADSQHKAHFPLRRLRWQIPVVNLTPTVATLLHLH